MMTTNRPNLLVVMPVFNERDAIAAVVADWTAELDRVVGNYVLLAIDDGSTDDSARVLADLQRRHPRIELLRQNNCGHGQSCLRGYRIAVERNIPHVLQVDSDGQCDPSYLGEFWQHHGECDVVYGKRSRQDGWRRVIASAVLKVMLRVAFDANCPDPNVPYRLMNTSACVPAFDKIPPDFFLVNVALAVLLAKTPSIRHRCIPIRFRQRIGGEPSVPFSKFGRKALELIRQLKSMERGSNAPCDASADDPLQS